ncbi:MAG: alkaline phosphatase D family protein [Gemmataceae bacterium]|nr:alkaline phosphatase D family protein [Gemmataceae bacterium]
MKSLSSSRRRFLESSLAAGGLFALDSASAQDADPGTRQATGVKVGEVSDTTAVVWMRLTAEAGRRAQGYAPKFESLPKDVRPDQVRYACPGMEGRVRLRYATRENLSDAVATAWQDVAAKTDFTHQFALNSLRPNSTYFYSAESAGRGGAPVHKPLVGQFQTAPAADQYADVSFTAISCTGFRDLDHSDGYHIFPTMARLNPRFYVHTGDNVYYDSDDLQANSVATARLHWQRMHGQPRQIAFHLRTPGYWLKDDHDTLANDCWPGQAVKRMLPLTFNDGLAVYREQVPMSRLPYRTFRWGRGLQIWLMEGRDFRSPNTMADGPKKSIWGAEQKDWLFKSLLASSADYKILISPTPIVGPDRAKGKNDNHSNDAFHTEGNEIRAFFRKHLPERFLVINGDRHWQYHSVHPETGLHEFCTGAGSDAHAGGSPGYNKKFHRFHRVLGGFLSVSFRREKDRNTLRVKHHDVMGKEVYVHAWRG